MSALFAPTPLPPRPVYQEADIAEKAASAANREIDTRLRESVETGRRKMERGFEVARRDYAEAREENRMDYERALNSPIAQFVSNIPQMALQIYDGIREKNAKEAWNLEQGRLQSQSMDAHMALWMLERDTLAKAQTEDLSDDEFLEMFYGGAMDIANSLSYSDVANLAELNVAAQLQVKEYILGQAQSFLTKFDAIRKTQQMQAQDGLIRSTAQVRLDAFEQGDFEQWDAWEAYKNDPANNIARQHTQEGGFLYSLEQSAIKGFLVNQGQAQFGFLYDQWHNNPSFVPPTDLVTGKPVEWSAKDAINEIYRKLFDKDDASLGQFLDLFDERLDASDMRESRDLLGQRATTLEDIGDSNNARMQQATQRRLWDGELDGLSLGALYSELRTSGHSNTEANTIVLRKQTEAKNNAIAIDKELKDRVETAKRDMQDLYSDTLIYDAQTNWQGSDKFLQEAHRAGALGALETGDGKFWADFAAAKDEEMLEEFQDAFTTLATAELFLNDQAVTKGLPEGAPLHVQDQDGNLVPVSAIMGRANRTLTEALINGVVGPDGERVFFKTRDDAVIYAKTLVARQIDPYMPQERPGLWKIFGGAPRETEDLRSHVDYDADYEAPGTVRAQPLVGMEIQSANALVVNSNIERLEEFQSLSTNDERLRFAANSLNLTRYGQGLTAEDVGRIDSDNYLRLSRAQDNGYIDSFGLDRGTAVVRFAKDGRAVVLDLHELPADEYKAKIERDWREFNMWMEEARAMKEQGLSDDTFWIIDTPDGESHVEPSVVTEGIMRTSASLQAHYAEALPWMIEVWDEHPAARKHITG